VYGVGEVVTMHISPPVMTGVGKWLIVWKPDYSWARIDFQPGSEIADSATVTADQPGQWRVELWGQIVYPGEPATLLATCTFEVQDRTPIPVVTVRSKTIFDEEFSGVRVRVQWRESGHRRTRTLATAFSLDPSAQGLYKFTAPSTVRVGGVQYRFAHWEDETNTKVSGSRTLSYEVQPGKTLYAVYGPRQYRLTVEVRDTATRARVPGATVEVTQLGQTYTAVTNSRGRAVIGGIYAGQTFTLKVFVNGELRYVKPDTVLTRNTTLRLYV
jgi:hypothetical protein